LIETCVFVTGRQSEMVIYKVHDCARGVFTTNLDAIR